MATQVPALIQLSDPRVAVQLVFTMGILRLVSTPSIITSDLDWATLIEHIFTKKIAYKKQHWRVVWLIMNCIRITCFRNILLVVQQQSM